MSGGAVNSRQRRAVPVATAANQQDLAPLGTLLSMAKWKWLWHSFRDVWLVAVEDALAE
jgi:hypothetical protein